MFQSSLAEITRIDDLMRAHKKAMRGKRSMLEATEFNYSLTSNLTAIQNPPLRALHGRYLDITRRQTTAKGLARRFDPFSL